MTNYESYQQAALYRRAMAARSEEARRFCIPMNVECSIRSLYNGENYINPAAMAIILGCDMFELMEALSKHKRYLATVDISCLDKYGNRNFEVHAKDMTSLQGWINFLSLDCFSDSLEAKIVVDCLKKAS